MAAMMEKDGLWPTKGWKNKRYQKGTSGETTN